MRLPLLRNESASLAAVAFAVVTTSAVQAVLEWRADLANERAQQEVAHVAVDVGRIGELRSRQQLLAAAAAADGGSAQHDAHARVLEEAAQAYRKARDETGERLAPFIERAQDLEGRLAAIEREAVEAGAGGRLAAARERLASGDYVAQRSLFDQALQLARAALEGDSAALLAASARNRTLNAAASAVVTMLLGAAWVWAVRGARRRQRAEAELAATLEGLDETVRLRTAELEAARGELEQRVADRTHELARSVAELQESQRATEALGEMTQLLQAAESLDDVPEILTRLLGRLLAGHSGAVYLAKASLNYLDRICVFGAGGECAQTIAPVECWALKRGHTYGAADAARDVFCAHVAAASARAGYVCVPMHARGAPVGMLHVCFAPGTAPTADAAAAPHGQLQHVAELVALGLANLRLRETLREQSIRDALTGLFNRRYLEEALERDLARAEREAQPLAVFMLDVDHFKRFNDVHGHEAGDAVLRTLARTLQQACRTGDLACRFGGEEFTVLLSGTGEAAAAQWAERLMQRVRALDLKHNGRSVGGITISLGLALFPDHGHDVEALLQMADLALYDAKRAGRDRLMVFRPSGAADEVAARDRATHS